LPPNLDVSRQIQLSRHGDRRLSAFGEDSYREEDMASNQIKTWALAAVLATCAGLGYSSVAEAHQRTMRRYGWHSHRAGAYYGYMRPATYGFGGYSMGMSVPAHGCAAPGYYGDADEQGEGGVGFGATTF
jgi:hypothetical protein